LATAIRDAPKVVLAVGLHPSRLIYIDEQFKNLFIIVVSNRDAKLAGMHDNYYRNAFSYIETTNLRTKSHAVEDVRYVLSLCKPARTCVDFLICEADGKHVPGLRDYRCFLGDTGRLLLVKPVIDVFSSSMRASGKE
jgi:hypothetical protein